MQEKRQETTLQGHSSAVASIAITSDSKYIVSGSGDSFFSGDFTVRIWNVEEKMQKAILQGHTLGVTSLIIIRNDKYVVSGSLDMTVRIWKLRDNK